MQPDLIISDIRIKQPNLFVTHILFIAYITYSGFKIQYLRPRDIMKSEDIRKELGVGSIKSKARESRLRWFGHDHRRDQETNLRQVMDSEIPGRRPRGRPSGRWRDLVDRDMRELRVVPEDADDRNLWRRRIRTADPSLG